VAGGGAGIAGSEAAAGATVLVVDAASCAVLGRWQGSEQRLGIRVEADATVTFVARDDEHTDTLAAAPLPTTTPCSPGP
jgi:hypothetical protein